MKKRSLSKVDSHLASSSCSPIMSRPRSLITFLLIGIVTIYYLLLATFQNQFFIIRPNNNSSSKKTYPTNDNIFLSNTIPPPAPRNPNRFLTSIVFTEAKLHNNNNSSLLKSALHAWLLGSDLWTHLTRESKKPITQNKKKSSKLHRQVINLISNKTIPKCPRTLRLPQPNSLINITNPTRTPAMVFPCGLRYGSYIQVAAKPRAAHMEQDSMFCQFTLELRKLRRSNSTTSNEQEEEEEEMEVRVMHFNPRLKGDWSENPVIEMNARYRDQWGSAIRCEGMRTLATTTGIEETVDGQLQCEDWIVEGDKPTDHTKLTYPFIENEGFFLAITSGLEGYHIYVDGKHIASFAYRTGYDLEDATGLYIFGDIDLHSLHAASLPALHPSITRHRYIKKSPELKAPSINPTAAGGSVIELFIGIASAGDHFMDRMAVRKTWFQHHLIKSSKVVARFFIALDQREKVNVELLKEAEFFGDIVILPYLDNYDLIVLKTIAICEYGVNTLAAKYVMKCDDDTFVRVDSVIQIAQKLGAKGSSFYAGKMNYLNKPHRDDQWAVTFEEWAEENYPPYADGGAYIISSDIAQFIYSEFENSKLKLFKMEDVSMGMWVQKFNSSQGPVHYHHSLRFAQFDCIDDYFTVHKQSPIEMNCLWKKLQRDGTPTCCNLR